MVLLSSCYFPALFLFLLSSVLKTVASAASKHILKQCSRHVSSCLKSLKEKPLRGFENEALDHKIRWWLCSLFPFGSCDIARLKCVCLVNLTTKTQVQIKIILRIKSFLLRTHVRLILNSFR